MPTEQQIRDAVKAKMLEVANVGVVHAYERYAASLADMKALYLSGGRVLGWHIRKARSERQSEFVGRIQVTHTWLIRGFMSLDDAGQSELAFDTLIESLQEAFAADESLGGLVGATVIEEQALAGLQLDDSGPVMFAGVLCHSARLRLLTRHHE